MLNIHDLIRLTTPKQANPIFRTIVFDGKVAVSMANAMGSRAWWAGVPYTQAEVTEPVAVPVDTIKAHLSKSRHLWVKRDHVHNNQGLRHPWPVKPDWNDVLCKLPPRPEGESIQFDVDLDQLDRVLVVVDPHDKRTGLTGVFFDFETGRLAGTDGARVHMYTNAVPKLARKAGQGGLQMIVPREPAHWLLRSEDKAAKVTVWKLGAGQSLVLMQTSEALVYTVALDAKFPDIARVMAPRERYRAHLKLDAIAFSDGVANMARLPQSKADAKGPAYVTVHWGQGRIYGGNGPAFVAFPHELVGFKADKDPVMKLYARYQPRYLQDVADCVTPDAVWGVPFAGLFGGASLGNSDRVLAVFDGPFAAVVMPMSWDNLEPPTDQIADPKKPPAGGKKADRPADGAKPDEKPAKGPDLGPEGPKPTANVVPLPVKGKGPAKSPAKVSKKA